MWRTCSALQGRTVRADVQHPDGLVSTFQFHGFPSRTIRVGEETTVPELNAWMYSTAFWCLIDARVSASTLRWDMQWTAERFKCRSWASKTSVLLFFIFYNTCHFLHPLVTNLTLFLCNKSCDTMRYVNVWGRSGTWRNLQLWGQREVSMLIGFKRWSWTKARTHETCESRYLWTHRRLLEPVTTLVLGMNASELEWSLMNGYRVKSNQLSHICSQQTHMFLCF